ELNASYDGDAMVLHEAVNVGVATAVDDGLVVPVVRHCDREPLAAIVRQARGLLERARSGRFASDDLTGATFTLSNLGMLPVTEFTAVINPPQAAIRAAQLGLRTAVVERDRPGGVCGNWGCIPSKAILADAALFAELKGGARRGILADNLRVDYARVIARSREVADRQAKGVEFLFKKNRIAYHHGAGQLVRGGVAVDGARLGGCFVLLASGSRERTLPGLEIDGEVVLTRREALERPALPASVVIVGGGAGGVEFAYIYATFGAKVVVVEMAETLLPGMDADLGRELARAFVRQGIDVLTGSRYQSLERHERGARVTVAGADGARTLEAAQVLVAVGRAPLSEDLGLGEAGVRTEKGFVVVDANLRTSVEGIYAI